MESSDQEFPLDNLSTLLWWLSPVVVSYLSYQAGILCCISVDSITTMSEVSSSLWCHVTHQYNVSLPVSTPLTRYFTSCYPISRKTWVWGLGVCVLGYLWDLCARFIGKSFTGAGSELRTEQRAGSRGSGRRRSQGCEGDTGQRGGQRRTRPWPGHTRH